MLVTGAYSWHPSTCHTCLRHFMNFISPQRAANNQIHSKIHENETQIYTRERKTMIEYYGGHESESLLTSRFVVVVIDVAGTAAFTAAAAVCNYSRWRTPATAWVCPADTSEQCWAAEWRLAASAWHHRWCYTWSGVGQLNDQLSSLLHRVLPHHLNSWVW